MEFVIKSIKLRSYDGMSLELPGGDFLISSEELKDSQLFLGELNVLPGEYMSGVITIAAASTGSGEERASYSIPESEAEIEFNLNLYIAESAVNVITLEWDPLNSVEKGVLFIPAIKMMPQRESLSELNLFVSNSKENYITIIDRDLERVVAALAVGRAPKGMALNSAKDRLFVLNSDSSSISIIDTVHLNVIDSISLVSEGAGSFDVAFMPESEYSVDGKLYVANSLSNDVTVVGTTERRALERIPVGMEPSSIVSAPSRKEVYVTSARSNELSVISTIDDTLVSVISVGARPVGLVVGPNAEKLYVLNEGSSSISVVSLGERAVVETITLVESPSRGVFVEDGRFFTVNGLSSTVTFFNSNIVERMSLQTGPAPRGIVVDEQRNSLYIANSGGDTVSLYDLRGEVAMGELTVGSAPYELIELER
jgi:YVTN family beta-propeller protein